MDGEKKRRQRLRESVYALCFDGRVYMGNEMKRIARNCFFCLDFCAYYFNVVMLEDEMIFFILYR